MRDDAEMTFEEFLALIRKDIGVYCSVAYWQWKYGLLKSKRTSHIKKQLPYLAVNAIASDYSSKHSFE